MIIFPKGTPQRAIDLTPKSVKEGSAHFVNAELLQKVIHDAGYTSSGLSKHLFYKRGHGHAIQKINDWLKYRYPAMNADLARVLDFIDPMHSYKLSNFWYSDYADPNYMLILNAYKGYQAQKKFGRERAKTRLSLARGDNSYGKQLNLFGQPKEAVR